jgi:hypothetical protein
MRRVHTLTLTVLDDLLEALERWPRRRVRAALWGLTAGGLLLGALVL